MPKVPTSTPSATSRRNATGTSSMRAVPIVGEPDVGTADSTIRHRSGPSVTTGSISKSHRIPSRYAPSEPARTTNTMRVVTRTRPGPSSSRSRVVLFASRTTKRHDSSKTRRSSGVAAAGTGGESNPVVVTINRSARSTTGLNSLLQKNPRLKSKSRVTFDLPEDDLFDSVSLVVHNDKFLVKIFRNLNWNELLPVRETCKKWLEVVSCDPNMKRKLPVIAFRGNVSEAMNVFNKSLVVWTQFRICSNFICDCSHSIQSEFWSKHGKTMTYLQIRNMTMSLTGFIDVLSRCTNLEHLTIAWTPEMYSFNSELIKKYFGIHFRNGTFARLKELVIERSSYIVDNALWSLLKWCGGPLRSLSLICAPDVISHLNRLKPRWSIEPIQNYVNRFGYTGQFRFLDFSNSNLSSDDLMSLGDTSALTNLTGIRLNNCQVSVPSIVHFINKKGSIIEELYLENVPSASDKLFNEISLPLLRILSISGNECLYENIDFVSKLHRLEEFHYSNTKWCDYSMITSPFESHAFRQRVKKMNIGANVKMCESSRRANFIGNSKWFSHFLAVLPNLVELDVSGWVNFGSNENFKLICSHLKQLQHLRVRNWRQLGDSGVSGIDAEELEKETNFMNMEMHYDIKGNHVAPSRSFIGSLKYLRHLDISNSLITDTSLKYGIIHLKHLRNLSMEETFISELGLQNLLQNCLTLDQISVEGCDQISLSKERNKIPRSDGRFITIGKF